MDRIGSGPKLSQGIHLIWAILFLFISGCAAVEPSAEMSYPVGTSYGNVSHAIGSSLKQNDFPIPPTNAEEGLVISDWRTTQTTGALISGTSHSNTFSQRMKLEFSIDQKSRMVTIRPLKQRETGSDGWIDVSLDDTDRLLVQNVVLSIASMLGGSVSEPQWIYPPKRELEKQDEQKQSNATKGAILALGIGVTIAATFVLLESLN